MTKVSVSTPSELPAATKASYKLFQDFFPIFSYEEMSIDHGVEVFLDLGFTFTPADSRPLVGLWRMDHLEASFSLGGYRVGTDHHTNTFDRYGGVQAEMKVEHLEQSHVSHSSAYNLIYQAYRNHANKVDSFHLADVARCTDRYSADVTLLRAVFREIASNEVSYGVRREFRIGLKAMQYLQSLRSEGTPIFVRHVFRYKAVAEAALTGPSDSHSLLGALDT